ncbi:MULTISPECIES: PucR family transcriptional regulator [Pseudonocardia]|uniref:Purine catabolism regulatory protein-like family protein n=2 Tax=Pseudonocardia TaxID=1847 RepID=A0A1Y2N0Q8_PSEAH|nr:MULTISPECIES: PucR family transcriptional regulator [Pseudonocardia]OSY41054.1 Purine catabolism regulatory protein-like family protein [Pseudonocardia autotrophica]TDN73818.1 purine catabolism regulator [Pseudonocardia autotrophica]BBG04565.1 hypothetical protein Pdca_57740 [Pseudonocardia autotrophica]GEC28943.1 hypothetical protein PSA01_59720 [Pseudonocardia saturnea]
MSGSGALTLRLLVAEPGLGLAPLGDPDLDVPVRGAHSIEIADAARWLRPGTLMLTTGLRLAAAAPDDRRWTELAAELAGARIAAIGFGTGIVFDEVPAGLRRAAAQQGIPVLTVDPEVPFTRIEEAVTRGVLADESYLLRRTVWLQDDLLAALVSTDPTDALMERLGALARGSAALFDASGRTVAATGSAPFRLIADELAGGARTFTVGRWDVRRRALRIGPSDYHLVIASREPRVLDDLGDDLLRTAGRVLAAASSVRVLTADQERLEAGRLLSALLAGLPSSRVRQTWERLRTFGFRPGESLRMVRWDAPEPSRPGSRYESIGRPEEPARLLVRADPDPTESGAGASALLADDEPGARWLESAAATGAVGASGPFTDLTVCPERAEEAGTAHRLARQTGRGGLVRLDEVSYATWLAATRYGDPRAADRFERQFGGLARAPDLLDTVVAYLACDQDVGASARRLRLHPNTVRYRLRKVESLLGSRIAAASTVADLYLAFRDEIEGLRDVPPVSSSPTGRPSAAARRR